MNTVGSTFGSTVTHGSLVATSKQQKETQKNMTLEGESILAVGCKKVIWKSWGWKWNIDQAVLDDKITWSILDQKRGRVEEDEVVGVELTDNLAANDNEDSNESNEGRIRRRMCKTYERNERSESYVVSCWLIED